MPLTDEQWVAVQPLLPSPFMSTAGAEPGVRVAGRPSLDQRLILDAILWKLRTASPWCDLPASFPSWQSCYRRFHYWQRQGILSAIITALDLDLRDRGGFNFRAALSARLIRLEPLDGQIYPILDSSLKDALPESWQRETVCLLLAVLFRSIRKKLPNPRLRLVPSTLLVHQSAPSSPADA